MVWRWIPLGQKKTNRNNEIRMSRCCTRDPTATTGSGRLPRQHGDGAVRSPPPLRPAGGDPREGICRGAHHPRQTRWHWRRPRASTNSSTSDRMSGIIAVVGMGGAPWATGCKGGAAHRGVGGKSFRVGGLDRGIPEGITRRLVAGAKEMRSAGFVLFFGLPGGSHTALG